MTHHSDHHHDASLQNEPEQNDFGLDEFESPNTDHLQVTPTSLPSLSVLFDPTRNQRVHLSTRYGSAPMSNRHHVVEIVEEILAYAEDLNKKIRGGKVFLRGLWHDNSRGGMIIAIQMQHDSKVPPMTATEIKEYFYDGGVMFGGQAGSVKVRFKSVDFGSDHYEMHNDEDYQDLFN